MTRAIVLWALVATLVGLPSADVAAQARVGDFAYVPLTDPMSDRDLTYIATPDLDREGAESAQLSWRCSGSVLQLVLRAPDLEELVGPVRVRWRFDQGPASDRQAWRSSMLAPVVHAPEAVVYPFSQIAAGAESVLIRAEDADGTQHDYRFSVRGLEPGLDRLSCVRHLELLGTRRLTAMYARASMGAEGARAEDGLARLLEQFPFVGHRTQRRYSPSSETCWQMLWDVEEIDFFRTEPDARASGYSKDTSCSSR